MKYWKMDISNKDLAVRKTWYSSVAKTYQQIRPKYPQILIDRLVELAKMPRFSL